MSKSGTHSIPKWQIALVAGAAVGAVSLSYMIYKSRFSKSSSKEVKENGKIKDKKVKKDASEEPETPLQKVINFKDEGNALFKKGKYDEAISFYTQAIFQCPEGFPTDLATFYQNRAAAYEQLKKWSAVVEDTTKALEFNPKYEKALSRRARAFESLGKLEECLDDITTVCLIQHFQNQPALMMADRVLKELGKQHAIEAIKNRKPMLPSKHFVKSYFISFSSDPVYEKLMDSSTPIGEGDVRGFLRAKLAFATENFEEIIPACTEEINSSESESEYYLEALSLRASFHLLCASHKEAFDDLKAAIDTVDADVKIKVNCLIKRASLYMQMGENEKCLEDFETAAELGPEISDVYHHRGQVKLLMEKTTDARQDFEKAVTLNPNYAIAYVQKCYTDYRYALMTQDVNLLTQSLGNFRRATEKFSNSSEVYILFAQVLTERQEFSQAEKLYTKAAELDPSNATILVHRGLLQLQIEGKFEKAVELMKESIKLDEKCEFAYETLATVEVQRGNLLLAIELFDKAIALARTEMEMTHLFSLRDAAASQLRVTNRLNIGPQLLKT
ncbi:mitochondrial import receptor subunit TOM70 [Agrilus planipennis]|uniref:Mitochondrial import receptor subunit TOM70 n=1 Tax=Agrilus planipennis TaxID=224129 RepID=A0A1W4XH15_AGRPL|nr:mitochondrial import receptor subunit TOM70 [Agrilus planipennis]